MFFKQNLAALTKKNPHIAQAVANAPETGRYRLAPSQRTDGVLNLLDLKANRAYYNNFDPLIGVKNELDSKKIKLGNVAVFLGFGAGYHIKDYLARYPFASVLVFENDPELLKTVMTGINLKDVLCHPGLAIAGCKAPNLMYAELFNFFNSGGNLGFLKAVNFIENYASIAADREFYLSSIRTVKDAISGVMSLYGNDPYDSLLGIKYTLRNIATIIDNPGIKSLEKAFKGKPGVIVATGPSLNKNVRLLEGLDDKAVIAAVDASVKVLKKHGLKPAHLVTSLERVEATAKLFEGLTPEDVKDSYLAACPVVVPETYANFPGDKIIVYRNFATFQWLDVPKGILDIGPSSANMAFKILEFMGCDPIIIIGQDLAYGENDKSHADGFHYGENFETAGAAGALTVEGNYTPTVKTSPVWYGFLKHYERDLARHTGKVINATEGGAKIHGTEVMTFAEAIKKYVNKDINVLETIRRKLKNSPSKIKENQVKSVLKKLQDAVSFCEEIRTSLKNGVELCLEYERIDPEARGSENADKLMAKICAVQEICNRKEFYLILMHYVQSFYMKTVMDLNYYRFALDPSVELNDKLVEKYKEMYSVLSLLIDKIDDEFKISIELLKDYEIELTSGN